MKVKIDGLLTNFTGEVVKEKTLCEKCEKEIGEAKDTTIKAILLTALNTWLQGSKPSLEEKLQAYHLCQVISKPETTELELTIEEASLIKKKVNEVYLSSLIIGRINDLLEKEE